MRCNCCGKRINEDQGVIRKLKLLCYRCNKWRENVS